MKKYLVPFVCILVILGVYSFFSEKESLPHDFGTVLISWQKERADNINDIISLWREKPLGKGERNVNFKGQYGDLSVEGSLKGAVQSDVEKTLSQWSPTLELNITPLVPTIPIPADVNIHGPITFGNTEAFFYLTLGKMLVTVPSKPDVQSQFQQIADIGLDKTFQIGENLPHWYSIKELSLFTEELRMKPIFLMAKDGGEKDGYYNYTMTLIPEGTTVLTEMNNVLQHCDLSIKKNDISDFLIDCHSETTRIVWGSDKTKITNDPRYQYTYEIYHKYSSGKRIWYVNMKEKEKLIRNFELFWTIKGEKVVWEITGEDVNSKAHFSFSGEENRMSDPTVSVSIPTSIASWKEILQQIVR